MDQLLYICGANRRPSWEKMYCVHFLGAFLTITASYYVSAVFQALGENGPLSVPVGEDAILPCRLSRIDDLKEVRWFRIRLKDVALINLFRDGKDQQTCYIPSYVGRTELITKHIDRGEVALKIRHVSVADEGAYRCYLETLDYFDHADFELNVTALGSDPRIDIEELQDGRIKAACKSSGWYPEPMLLTKDTDGIMVELGFSKKTQNENGLYDIEYSGFIAENSSRTFSCVLRTAFPNQQRECSLYMAEAVFKKPDSSTDWRVTGILIAFFIVAVIVTALAFTCHWYSKRRLDDSKEPLASISVRKEDSEKGHTTEEELCDDALEIMPLKKDEELQIKEKEQFQNDLDRAMREKEALKCERDSLAAENVLLKANAGPATFSPAVIYMDSETANPNLHLSPDRKSMQCRDDNLQGPMGSTRDLQSRDPQRASSKSPAAGHPTAFDTTLCVLGSQGFTQGRHYWEVAVQSHGGKGWAVGVAQETVRRIGEVFPRPRDGIWAVGKIVSEYTAFGDNSMILKLDVVPQRIRVFLNLEGQVDFYNADNMCHIFTFMPSFKDKVYPFFLTMDGQTSMSLC